VTPTNSDETHITTHPASLARRAVGRIADSTLVQRMRRFAFFVASCGPKIWRDNPYMVLVTAASVVLGTTLVVVAIVPRYADPSTRIYSSKLGFGTASRKMGRPFDVSAQTVRKQTMKCRLQGEGLIGTEPVQVPIVAMARILKVHAIQGDRVTKGQLLVELDSRRAQVKLEAARSAVKTALAEQQRTLIGSAYILANERPDAEKIRLDMSKRIVWIQERLAETERMLALQGVSSNREYLLSQIPLITVQAQLNESERAYVAAKAGRKESIGLAECALAEAELALKYRELELEDYRVISPCDGVVERCVVHDGEYNQDPGKPAFLIDRGLWFEARMDQTVTGRLAVGDPANVHLEAYPNQPMPGRISLVAPMVSYDSGGPEATRPIRPLGSGAPEWPSTFAVRIEVDAAGRSLVPGLTGFARIDPERNIIAVPIEAIFGRSGRSALVYVVDDSEYRSCKVILGTVADGWAEIRSGLDEGAVVLTDGHQVLEPGDRIQVISRDGSPVSSTTVRTDAGRFDK
jgi:HlyD family secretion protein